MIFEARKANEPEEENRTSRWPQLDSHDPDFIMFVGP